MLTELLDAAAHAYESPLHRQFFTDTLEYAQRGRMVRGSVVIHTWQTLVGADSASEIPASVLMAASCIELFESALLIHDDIIDRDDLRRGKPSLHHTYAQLTNNTADSISDPKHMGSSLALTLGDILFFYIYKTLSELPETPETRLELTKNFSTLALSTGLGQSTDIAAGFRLLNLSQQDILQMYADKTASYSFCLPLQFGSILAGHPSSKHDSLTAIGKTLGVLYQLADDHKGIFSSTAETGKAEGGDIREGKQTYYRLVALKVLRGESRERFIELYGKQALSASQLEEMREFFRHPDIKESISHFQVMQEKQLTKNIETLDAPETFRSFLYEIWQLAVAPLSLES